MDPRHLFNLVGTVELRTPGTDTDEFGDAIPVLTVREFQCAMQQTARTEDTALADTQLDTRTLWLEAAAADVVDGSSAITVAGVAYEFIGPPWPAQNPRTNEVEFVVATVKRVV